MSIGFALVVAGLVAGAGGLVLPALAQTQDEARTVTGQSMRGMMSGGCAGMMQSMTGGDGRPNSQWQRHRHSAAPQG